ncbi:MAG: class I SAM-dependent methyltransferase [Candidatus Omnitrophica bacterium]|nr:class I SAM-dependent methyltransferase [Candidatus Omnitrophota bacterium]MCB9721553.1 class I SAM-dependent methyltransferase [Candidatus Omnitrophota bacterium]
MPTIDENKKNWEDYHWDTQGDKWSEAWGTVDMQWYGTLLPRLHQFVPAGTILEIAPGYGRWTHYLKDNCDQLIIVDLVQKCIDFCKERFAQSNHISYHTNDGKSLSMVPDGSVDLVFSFDSLVHVEEDVIRDYLKEFARVLKPDGFGFIHHSNLGEYRDYLKNIEKVAFAKEILYKLRLTDHITNWRAPSMTADKLDGFAAETGLQVLTQEKINWGRSLLSDCISTFTPKNSRYARPRKVIANPHFRRESDYLRDLSGAYQLTDKQT